MIALLACSSPVIPPPPPPIVAPARPARAPATASRGDYCATDADCAWDDPCMPTRCGAGVRGVRACDESSKPPGECGCVENQCTNQWAADAPIEAVLGCAGAKDCAIDVGTGTCVLRGATMIGPIATEGPMCVCDLATTACERVWISPIPCATFAECDVDKVPRLHPIKAAAPRTKPVTMCVDGSVDAVCTDQGVCMTVAAGC